VEVVALVGPVMGEGLVAREGSCIVRMERVDVDDKSVRLAPFLTGMRLVRVKGGRSQ